MKLDYLQALKRVDQAKGAWLLHGAEPLLEQNLLEALRKQWQQQDVERQRFDLSNAGEWKQVFNALNSLSLFSTQLAIEVHGNIKPDAAGLKLLKHYLQYNEQNILVIVMPKQDSSSLKSAFFQLLDANAVTVSLTAHTLHEQKSVLAQEALKLGVELTDEAWQWLMQHHEHHLLAAKNSLMRVADTFPTLKLLELSHLLECLQDQSRYSTYDLNDAVLAGDLHLAVKIYQFLIAAGEPASLLLWSISKEMRLLMQLYEQPQNAVQLGIWRNRIPMYQKALRRFSPQVFLAWPQLLMRIDAAIKGMSKENAEHLILQAISEMCGQRLFATSAFN